jgi:hypothetical protein
VRVVIVANLVVFLSLDAFFAFRPLHFCFPCPQQASFPLFLLLLLLFFFFGAASRVENKWLLLLLLLLLLWLLLLLLS